MTYILYINGEERQKVTTYKTRLNFDTQTTTFGESTAYAEIKYEEEKTNKSNEVKVEDTTIADENEFVNFRDAVNDGNTYEGKTIQLIDNIDLSSICGEDKGSFTPINTFKGTFDGNYHTIDNLYMREEKSRLGLFTTVDEKSTIRKIQLENVDISNTINSVFVGGICGVNYGTIEECGIISGKIVSRNSTDGTNNNIGGIAGTNAKDIKKCYNSANITAEKVSSTGNWILEGGICGINSSKIENCYNIGNISGSVTGKEYIAMGGISGYSIVRKYR